MNRGLGDKMMRIIASIHPLCEAKEPMREELCRLRRERKDLEGKLARLSSQSGGDMSSTCKKRESE